MGTRPFFLESAPSPVLRACTALLKSVASSSSCMGCKCTECVLYFPFFKSDRTSGSGSGSGSGFGSDFCLLLFLVGEGPCEGPEVPASSASNRATSSAFFPRVSSPRESSSSRSIATVILAGSKEEDADSAGGSDAVSRAACLRFLGGMAGEVYRSIYMYRFILAKGVLCPWEVRAPPTLTIFIGR